MLIYNITTMVEPDIAPLWLSWMQESHIPEVMASGCFDSYKLVRLLETDETQGLTYAVQYHAPDRASYDRYAADFAPGLQREIIRLWEGKSLSFPSLMEVVK
jgi:hypothetical protein